MFAPPIKKSGPDTSGQMSFTRAPTRARRPAWPWAAQTRPSAHLAGAVLQRKCDCGAPAPKGGICAGCEEKTFGGLQRKLAIGASNDPLEHEADRVADQVVSAPSPGAIAAAPLRIQRAPSGAPAHDGDVPASVIQALSGSGRALDGAVRHDMEARFGRDFSRVRVHDGAAAEISARDVGARAYTVGSSIVFGAGQFAPAAPAGRRLLAHELTHVVQQGFSEPVTPRDSLQTQSRLRVAATNGHGGSVFDAGPQDAGPQDASPIAGAPVPAAPAPQAPAPGGSAPAAPAPQAPAPGRSAPAPCPVGIRGPASLDHYCAAYVPSEEASCGTYPAPNITLTALGATAGVAIAWDITRGGAFASIVGANNGSTVTIKGDGASGAANDVTVRLSNGPCSATHNLTVRQPKSLSLTQVASSGPSFVQTIVTYTLKDQFGQAMGAGICLDETMTVCASSLVFTPQFGDAPTLATGQQTDTLAVSVTGGPLPASLCVKINQSITGGGCGPLVNNTILYRPSGITLTPGGSCAVGDPCP